MDSILLDFEKSTSTSKCGIYVFFSKASSRWWNTKRWTILCATVKEDPQTLHKLFFPLCSITVQAVARCQLFHCCRSLHSMIVWYPRVQNLFRRPRNEAVSDMTNQRANKTFEHNRTNRYIVKETIRISEWNSLRAIGVVKMQLLRPFHQKAKLDRFLVLAMGKNFT